ncbi:hypothetical protein YPPY48_1813, partial [Yersinia pestis PY-48]
MISIIIFTGCNR